MFQKRQDQDEEAAGRSEMIEAETARSSAESSNCEKPIEPKKDEEHVSIFWRLFGGTILSIVALVTITLYNNMSSSIADLRTDLSHEREARAELVKKDDFNTRANAQSERMRGIDSLKVELEGQKEKITTSTTTADAVKKETNAALEVAKKDNNAAIEAAKKETNAAIDSLKKDAAALGVLKERISELEAVKKDFTGLDLLKEKLSNATADLKVLHDEMTKVAGDLERNKLSDLERKTARDAQYKQVEESLKELQKGLQDCREKLARLEGSKSAPGEVPPPLVRPTPPSIAKPASPSTPGEVKPAGGTTTPGSGKPGPEKIAGRMSG